jgi:hypothetical protein
VDDNGGVEIFDGFVTEVCGGGLPSASVVAFQEGEEELKRVVVSVMSKAWHRGAVTSHMAVVGELTTHGATDGGIV